MHQTQVLTESSVRTLNNLIETAKDGENGFRAAAEDCSDTHLKQLFTDFSKERGAFARDLQSYVERQGDEPEEDGSVGGAIHRGWINLKSSLSPRDGLAVLEECVRGEEYAVKQYQDALSKNELGPATYLVQRQYEDVTRTHRQIKALRIQEERKTDG